MVHTPKVPTTPDQTDAPARLYTYADGILDVAYEEIAEARANCFRAFYYEKTSEKVYEIAKKQFQADYDQIGRIPYKDLEALIARYARQNKSKIYQIADFEIVGE